MTTPFCINSLDSLKTFLNKKITKNHLFKYDIIFIDREISKAQMEIIFDKQFFVFSLNQIIKGKITRTEFFNKLKELKVLEQCVKTKNQSVNTSQNETNKRTRNPEFIRVNKIKDTRMLSSAFTITSLKKKPMSPNIINKGFGFKSPNRFSQKKVPDLNNLSISPLLYKKNKYPIKQLDANKKIFDAIKPEAFKSKKGYSKNQKLKLYSMDFNTQNLKYFFKSQQNKTVTNSNAKTTINEAIKNVKKSLNKTEKMTPVNNSLIPSINNKRPPKQDNLSSEISPLLKKVNCPDFDIFSLDSVTKEKAPIFVANEIVKGLSIVSTPKVDKKTLSQFIDAAVAGYSRKNAVYHNDLHGADVMQTVFTMLTRGNYQKKMVLDDVSMFAILIGSLCHDLRHTGQNNLFHVNTKSEIALRFNNISVLENYHIANIFELTKNDKLNIFKNFNEDEYKLIKKRIHDGIIATDMANHNRVIDSIKELKIEYDIEEKKGDISSIFTKEKNPDKVLELQQTLLNMLIHTADISNPGKPDNISAKWTEKVYEEFFRQGDLEKKMGIAVSAMCDRDVTNVNKCMIGFINFIVMPTIDLLHSILPEIPEYSENIRQNLKKHESLWEIDQEKMKKEEEQKKN